MTRIEYSTMCLSPENFLSKIKAASKFVESQGFDFGIQIHNSIELDFFNLLLPLRNDYHFSIHSPIFSKYFLNLASNDYILTKTCIDKCVSYLPTFNTDILFFHGFFMTETPIIQDMKNYRKTIRNSVGEQYSLNKSFIMNPAFFKTDVFTKYKEVFREHFKKLVNDYHDKKLTIALENDFVGIGSGLQRPKEIHELIDKLWFDLGHFWTASVLHEFDFHEEAKRIIEEKEVVGVHLNHNLIKRDSPKELIRDSHQHFYLESEMNLAPIVRSLLEKKVGIVTLEILDGDLRDLEIFFNWLK